MRRLLAGLRDELLPVARPDDRVGIRAVPGGEEGYADAVARHTTTDLTPEEIHQIGLDILAELRPRWLRSAAGRWGRATSRRSPPGCAPTRRCGSTTSAQIVDAVARRAAPARRRRGTSGSPATTSRRA